MRSSQLKQLAENHPLKKFFKIVDVCACNELPYRCYTHQCPSIYFVNTEPNYESGSHWICIYVHKINGKIIPYFFDPLGIAPSKYSHHFVRFLKNTGYNAHYVINRNRIQPELSPFCAYYCLYFYFSMQPGLSPEYIAKQMLEISEENVVKYALQNCNLL